MIEASWIVLLGEHRGTTVKSWYSLTYSESKKGGKPFAGGLSDMAAGAASVGNPITERIPLVANTEVVSELEALQIATTAAKVFKSHLGGISVELVVKEEPNKDEPERPYTRVVVVGPYEIEESSVTSPTEPSVDFFA
ncbi:MAG: hypothetical protein ACREQ5_32830 [Candidatus Dormibacteria bacterium]